VPSDLAAACVFCASLLFSSPMAPPRGFGADLGVGYATLERRDEPAGQHRDLADTTAKFIFIGLGGARPAAPGLGAGTPAAQWRLRFAFAPSHDDQDQNAHGPGFVASSGNGRYENFEILGRVPIGRRDSIEAAWSRRYSRTTDLFDEGAQRYVVSSSRELTAERVDLGLGVRHRFANSEISLSARDARPNGSHATQDVFQIARGDLWGGSAEWKLRRGRWTGSLSAEYLAGSLEVTEKSQPTFASRTENGDARLEAYRAGVTGDFGATEAYAAIEYGRQRLPFSSLAVTGSETVAFEDGYHPDSRVRETVAHLAVRKAVTPTVRLKAFLRLAWGSETVRLTDSTGALPPRTIDPSRGGTFGASFSQRLGSPEIAIGLGADLWLSSPEPPAP